MNDIRQQAGVILDRVREKKPLIHHITNIVVANITANVTLAIGALPVMAHAIDEAAEMAEAANALVLNMGTPNPEQLNAMIAAGKAANRKQIPVVFDPVGVGATSYRAIVAETILKEVTVSVLRANASEAAFLIGARSRMRGVEAAGQDMKPCEIALAAARQLGCVVAVTGAEDHVSDGEALAVVGNGHPMMARITGSGCAATSVVAAFCAVETDFTVASASALAFVGTAGELAAAKSSGPGSFQALWLDRLADLDSASLSKSASVSWASSRT